MNGQILLSGNQEKDSIAINNSLLRDQTKSLVGSELVHSVDGRWAQGRNGQLNPTEESSEAREEIGTPQEPAREARQEPRESMRI